MFLPFTDQAEDGGKRRSILYVYKVVINMASQHQMCLVSLDMLHCKVTLDYAIQIEYQAKLYHTEVKNMCV